MQPSQALSFMAKAGITAKHSGKIDAILAGKDHFDAYINSMQKSQQAEAKISDTELRYYGLGSSISVKLDDKVNGMEFVDKQGNILSSIY
jgi:hypothetical protein